MVEQRWEAGKRRDGLAVLMGIDGWVIMPHAEGLPVTQCPCCDKPFARDDRGLRAAQLVADALYPLEDLIEQPSEKPSEERRAPRETGEEHAPVG